MSVRSYANSFTLRSTIKHLYFGIDSSLKLQKYPDFSISSRATDVSVIEQPVQFVTEYQPSVLLGDCQLPPVGVDRIHAVELQTPGTPLHPVTTSPILSPA